ncbi:Cyclic nucleotide-binding-like protein [Dioscorea alata]|uniref:Cyclic nucleotide-binding-like protein n=2 Tax=Dioscorea alata TaxID=55571 RepID=A0ACB7WQE2_DIOAL|nr:Cyclic nucleotide-binding-like protein [Dioscorea alata]KAH7690336.1 Cyclic nucleotide-binding-like protein [Dioscorea alata]
MEDDEGGGVGAASTVVGLIENRAKECWLAKEDCMCSRVVPCSLWNGIRFWLYMHPKDFLRQNNTGKLLWQLFGTQSVSLCIFGIHEHEEMMWDAFRSSGKEKIWFLYPSKSAAPKLVQDIFFNSSYSNLDGQMTWSERRRFDLAGSLSSILRAQLHAYDPLLMMTLRYLMSIHKVFCTHQDIPSPISDITERFLFEDHDPPISSHESLYEVPPFEEVDIQALVHAAGLTRQDAVDSLRFAKGDLFQAFQDVITYKNGTEKFLSKVRAADMAGEIGVIFNIPQPFTVRTKRLSQVVRISHRHFTQIVQPCITDGHTIVSNFVQFLKGLKEEILEEIPFVAELLEDMNNMNHKQPGEAEEHEAINPNMNGDAQTEGKLVHLSDSFGFWRSS